MTSRSLDHFVLYAHDLESAANRYRRLGFRVMPAMEHVEIGTSNVIVQFHETYLEIIGDFEHCRIPELKGQMTPWHALGDVFWMTALTSTGLEADRPVLEAKGLNIEPIRSARRRLRLPDGGWTETDSRSMYVWNTKSILTSMFVCDHRKPEAIWIPAFQSHPNSAVRVAGIRYLINEPTTDLDYFTRMFGGAPIERTPGCFRFETPRGEFLELLSEEAGRSVLSGLGTLEPGVSGRGASMTIIVESLERCRWALRDGGVLFQQSDEALVVAAAHAGGIVLEFRAQ